MEKKEEKMTEKNETIEIPEGNKTEGESLLKDKDSNSPQSNQDIQKLKEKLAQAENQYLRLLADFQNLQKRTAQEKEDLYKFAAQKTIEVILPALDTFDYARTSVKPDSKIEKVVEDFTLVFDTLLKCLKDIGLETIDETGLLFNPFQHEPLHQISTNELPDHTVMQVLKKGYTLNQKVIRPALVSVSVKQDDKGSEKNDSN